MSIVTKSMTYDGPSSPPRPFLILATGSGGVSELFPRFPFHERRCGLALGKAVADNMRSTGRYGGTSKDLAMEMPTISGALPTGDFMRHLVRGLALITLVLSCAACGGPPTVLIAFRTEEQAQTHCPKDIVVWLDAQTGLYYFKGHGSYGRSNAGRYACRAEADDAGMHAMPN
jgi:hypothetical protein